MVGSAVSSSICRKVLSSSSVLKPSQSTNLLAVTADSPQNDNCNLDAGIITATAQFGTPPYEFQYLPDTDPAPTAASAGWTSATTANVEAGDYNSALDHLLESELHRRILNQSP